LPSTLSISVAASRSAIRTWSRRLSATTSPRLRLLPPFSPRQFGYGRSPAALVAGGGSPVVQVQLRRGDTLFVNDGVYGSLSDAGALGFRFPARRIRLGEADALDAALADFALFGPTCDSADRMRGRFRLPAGMREGDWVELGQLGAYGACLRTQFNGFGRVELVEVADPPMLLTPGYEED
jgi:ornithine decarboxylase